VWRCGAFPGTFRVTSGEGEKLPMRSMTGGANDEFTSNGPGERDEAKSLGDWHWLSSFRAVMRDWDCNEAELSSAVRDWSLALARRALACASSLRSLKTFSDICDASDSCVCVV